MSDVGTGVTLAFSTTSLSMEIAEIQGDGRERPAIDDTHLATAVARTKIPGKLYEPGTLNLKVRVNPNSPPWKWLTHPAENITLQYPPRVTTATQGARELFQGFVQSAPVGGIMVDQLLETDVVIQISGPVSHSAAA